MMTVNDYYEAEERMCHPCKKGKVNGVLVMTSIATVAAQPLSRRKATRCESIDETSDHRAMLRASCARMMARCNYVRKNPHETYNLTRTSFALRAESHEVCQMFRTPCRPVEDSLPLPHANDVFHFNSGDEEEPFEPSSDKSMENEVNSYHETFEECIEIVSSDMQRIERHAHHSDPFVQVDIDQVNDKYDSAFYSEESDAYDFYDDEAAEIEVDHCDVLEVDADMCVAEYERQREAECSDAVETRTYASDAVDVDESKVCQNIVEFEGDSEIGEKESKVLIKGASLLDTVLFPKDQNKSDAECIMLKKPAITHIYGNDVVKCLDKNRLNIDLSDSENVSDEASDSDKDVNDPYDSDCDNDYDVYGDIGMRVAKDELDTACSFSRYENIRRKMSHLTRLRA